MQQQWGMAMAAALIACEDSVLRLVDVRDGREARSSRYERVDGRGAALLDLRATHYRRVA